MTPKDGLKNLINVHSRRLQKLKEQKALYGLSIDPRVLIEIEDVEAEIKKLQTELKEFENKETILFQDDFLLNKNGWIEGKYSTVSADTVTKIISGKLRRSVIARKKVLRTISIPYLIVKDFFLSVNMTIIEVSGKAAISIAFRNDKQTEDRYYVRFTNDGTYRIRVRQDKRWEKVLGQGQLDKNIVIGEGITNTFALLVKGPYFTIFVNDQRLTTVEDSTLNQAGQILLGTELYKAGQVIAVRLQWSDCKVRPRRF